MHTIKPFNSLYFTPQNYCEDRERKLQRELLKGPKVGIAYVDCYHDYNRILS